MKVLFLPTPLNFPRFPRNLPGSFWHILLELLELPVLKIHECVYIYILHYITNPSTSHPISGRQVLRFQYLQKEVDLEIERREARKESQQEAKARKPLEVRDQLRPLFG